MRKPVFGRRRGRAARPSFGRRLEPVEIKRFTEFEPETWRGLVRPLRSANYWIDERWLGGDAPKDFIWVDDASGRSAYLAKVGHQYYPAESVTEQVMTRIGQICGMNIADSKLMICANQLRFLSRYFLTGPEILNHGADILAGYLEDRKFVDGMDDKEIEKDIFTFQVFCTAIKTRFPPHHERLIADFVRLIGFDALVGNQDRHFYNWGIITHPTGLGRPRFSPIYDTARGLFWNITESGLVKYQNRPSLDSYVRKSTPQIGWDGWNRDKAGELCHFDLIQLIAAEDTTHWHLLKKLSARGLESLHACNGMIDAEFDGVLSPLRRELMKECLRARFEQFAKVL